MLDGLHIYFRETVKKNHNIGFACNVSFRVVILVHTNFHPFFETNYAFHMLYLNVARATHLFLSLEWHCKNYGMKVLKESSEILFLVTVLVSLSPDFFSPTFLIYGTGCQYRQQSLKKTWSRKFSQSLSLN